MLINRYKRIIWIYIMRQTACQVVNPITFDSYALLFNCMLVVRISVLITGSPLLIFLLFIKLSQESWALMLFLWLARRASTSGFL